ncbi:hypothetical protein J6590_029342 [Homalodisca vitripennis]|nr:hypothetical protein J6590_029342 [Homalodisca vitripennis]
MGSPTLHQEVLFIISSAGAAQATPYWNYYLALANTGRDHVHFLQTCSNTASLLTLLD